uniref:Uncharacterized protein n=1 Tax=Glossina pallidipes TaxID=7398 RepID=A0A1A9ZCA5_GLOPL
MDVQVEEFKLELKPEEMEEKQFTNETNLQKRVKMEKNSESPGDGQEEEQKNSQKGSLKENYALKNERSGEDNIHFVSEMENNPPAEEVQAPKNDKCINQDQKPNEQQGANKSMSELYIYIYYLLPTTFALHYTFALY